MLILMLGGVDDKLPDFSHMFMGDRAGNTSLEEIAMILKCHKDIDIDTNINTSKIYPTSRMVSSLMNMEKTHEHLIIACVGTNVNRQSNIAKAREILDSTFADCRFSRVMLTLPIGMGNTNVRFANMLVVFNSTLDTEEVVSKLKQIERQCGDTRMARSRG